MYKDRKGNYHTKPENIQSQKRESANGVYTEEGKVLLVKPSWVDIWEFPGGGKESEEDLITALKREFLEETGHEIIKFEKEPICHINTKFYADDLDIYFDSCVYFFKILEIKKRDDIAINRNEIIDTKMIPILSLTKENMNNIHMDIINKI